jgi:hypothetical protein
MSLDKSLKRQSLKDPGSPPATLAAVKGGHETNNPMIKAFPPPTGE